MSVAEIFYKPTSDLLDCFADYNPRIHTPEDIEWTFASMLEVGWMTAIAFNLETNTIIGGHGRVLAAQLGTERSQEWYDNQWIAWLQNHKGKDVAEHHQHRFYPNFWSECPCIGGHLDLVSEKATNIRLNTTHRDGRNDPSKVAALLDGFTTQQKDHAGFDKDTAKSFIDAYLIRQKTPEPTTDKPLFTKSEGLVDPKTLDFSKIDDKIHEYKKEATYTENIQKIYWQMSKEEYDEYLKNVQLAAEVLGIPIEGRYTEWRPKVVLAALQNVVGYE